MTIAVITPYSRTFHIFMKDVFSTDIKFREVKNCEDCRGIVFSGYIELFNSQEIKNYFEVINIVKSRIK